MSKKYKYVFLNKYKNNYLKIKPNIFLVNIRPILLINIYKNNVYFSILNHMYKNLLFFNAPNNLKKTYNLKTIWLLLLKKIKIIFKFIRSPINILQYRWFYFVKYIYLYLFKSVYLEQKLFYSFKKPLIIDNIMFKKLFLYTRYKTKKKRSLKRKLVKKIFI